MAALRSPLLVDLIDRKVPGSPLIRSLDLAHELVPDGPAGLTAFGDLGQMDTRIEVVEDFEIPHRCFGRWVDAEQVDRVGIDPSWVGFHNGAVEQGPGLSDPLVAGSGASLFHRLEPHRGFTRNVGDRQKPGRSKAAGGHSQEFVARCRAVPS